jgi:glycosyltransferase involved in cell wall biosynthesis
MLPGIARDDIVVLWNGGLWNWLDPLTAIRAMALLARDEPRVRLVFMGTRSPSAQVAEMGIVASARDLAAELDLLDRHVFFNDWVPYDERASWLLEADVALTLHVATVEARYAFRTRLLDNLWCGVPTVATEGDVLADVVRDEDIGLTVPPGDPAAVAAAIRHVINPDTGRQLRARIATVAPRYTWEQVSAPLRAYCDDPWRLGTQRDADERAAYVHRLERLYSETAQYARHLEQAIADKDMALRTAAQQPSTQRRRPDLGALFRRSNRG